MGVPIIDIRHNRGGVEEVRKRWGDRPARGVEIHLRGDEA